MRRHHFFPLKMQPIVPRGENSVKRDNSVHPVPPSLVVGKIRPVERIVSDDSACGPSGAMMKPPPYLSACGLSAIACDRRFVDSR